MGQELAAYDFSYPVVKNIVVEFVDECSIDMGSYKIIHSAPKIYCFANVMVLPLNELHDKKQKC